MAKLQVGHRGIARRARDISTDQTKQSPGTPRVENLWDGNSTGLQEILGYLGWERTSNTARTHIHAHNRLRGWLREVSWWRERIK